MLDGFEYLEERDASDKITHEGVVSKKTALTTSDNAGIYDAIAKDLRLLAEASTTLSDDSDLQEILADVKSMYDDMRTNPNFGSTEAKAQAEEALKQAKAAAASAASAKKYGDKATSVAAAISTVESYIEQIEALEKSVSDNATIAQNKAAEITEYEKNAASSESAAAASATAAKTSETNAKTSETNAVLSASAAAASATAAKTSETNAKTSETNATSSASAAAASESAAKTSETNAANSQTAAASSASAASTSATQASDHETNAKTALASCQNIQTQVNAGLQSLTSAVKYRGSVASFSDLPTTDLSTGDMYNVKSAGGTDSSGTAIKAGDNVVYNGSGWDDQAGTVDLSDYPTNEDVAKAVISATVADDTVTLIHKDATQTAVTVNNVAHATAATNDDKGQTIDIAAIKTLIQTTVDDAVLATKQAIFPVGSIYISMTDSRNPAEILGFGTWEALPAGHSLVAVGTATETHGDTTKTFTFEAGKTYGEFEHQLTVGELARHWPSFEYGGRPMVMNGSKCDTSAGLSEGRLWRDVNKSINDRFNCIGNDEPHNNISPSISSYFWQRVS